MKVVLVILFSIFGIIQCTLDHRYLAAFTHYDFKTKLTKDIRAGHLPFSCCLREYTSDDDVNSCLDIILTELDNSYIARLYTDGEVEPNTMVETFNRTCDKMQNLHRQYPQLGAKVYGFLVAAYFGQFDTDIIDDFTTIYTVDEIREKVVPCSADYWQIMTLRHHDFVDIIKADQTGTYKNIVLTENFRKFYYGYSTVVHEKTVGKCKFGVLIEAYKEHSEKITGSINNLSVEFFGSIGLDCKNH